MKKKEAAEVDIHILSFFAMIINSNMALLNS